MGKVKSAIVLTLITIVIAVLCVVCFVPFPCDGNGLNYFNSILGIAEKDADSSGRRSTSAAATAPSIIPKGSSPGEITRTTSRRQPKTRRKSSRPTIRLMQAAPSTSKKTRCSTAPK